jgi:tRNA(adenine34) deaminase
MMDARLSHGRHPPGGRASSGTASEVRRRPPKLLIANGIEPLSALRTTPPADDLDPRWMRAAIAEARRAPEHEDTPVGAVIVRGDEIIAAAHNERERREDPTAHAEVLALRAAAARLGTWRVLEATLYVTLEPCAMCAGAIVLARVPRVVYGAADPKAGAAGSALDVLGVRERGPLNHRPAVRGGVLAGECGELLREFFRSRRRRPGAPDG